MLELSAYENMERKKIIINIFRHVAVWGMWNDGMVTYLLNVNNSLDSIKVAVALDCHLYGF